MEGLSAFLTPFKGGHVRTTPLTTYRRAKRKADPAHNTIVVDRAPRTAPDATAMHPWVLVLLGALLLMCSVGYVARGYTIDRLTEANDALIVENARLADLDVKRTDEISGLAQRAVDAENEAAAIQEDLDQLMLGPSSGGVR